MQTVNIFWFRRDLRLDDNRGLFECLKKGVSVLPVFIFDKNIISSLPKDDHRVTFIHQTLTQMRGELQEQGSSLSVLCGDPEEIFKEIFREYDVQSIMVNRDYEPYAIERDQKIETLCHKYGVVFESYKDQVIFEQGEIVKSDGSPYVVYTPYKNRWREKFNSHEHAINYKVREYAQHFLRDTELPFLTLSDIGFVESNIKVKPYRFDENLVSAYVQARDFPAQDQGTSRLSPYLRFGQVSIRRLVREVHTSVHPTFLNELIWREFFMHILWHFPHTVHQEFREQYAGIVWRNDEQEFEKWKRGETGFPLVDAGMRELNTTGYMHNRVRMVVASFLCKDLLIDWRWGERYFAQKLFDYELSSNVGNWQWAAGTGVDAAPYFRIFNPQSQFEKFDQDGAYVRRWVPEYFGLGYVPEMVDHREARIRCLDVYKRAIEDYKKHH